MALQGDRIQASAMSSLDLLLLILMKMVERPARE